MVFDLVRPLGAAKGEFEVNTLFFRPLRRGTKLEWAPEIEYAFRKGYAVEFELPVEGSNVESYKIALQGTLNGREAKRYVHGWQGIGYIRRDQQGWQSDMLYISGIRFTRHWSTLMMHGARLDSRPDDRRFSLLANHSVFRSITWRRSVLGLESNLRYRTPRDNELLLMPQMHLRLNDRINLQVGTGVMRQEPGRAKPAASWRLVREF